MSDGKMTKDEAVYEHVLSLKFHLMKLFDEMQEPVSPGEQQTLRNAQQDLVHLTTALKDNGTLTSRLEFLLTGFTKTLHLQSQLSPDNEIGVMLQFNDLYRTIYSSNTSGFETYSLGHVHLQRGASIPDCKIAYKTFGTLNADKTNVIVYPTWYSGFFIDNEWLIGKGMALDPAHYFIIVISALGNGQSSSPSNTAEPYNASRFPEVTLYDNVSLQHRLVTELFGITKVKLVVGWSMGAQQSFQWAALYPEMVERVAPFCGSAKTSPHNYVFLNSLKQTLTTDVAWKDGFYHPNEQPKRGVRAFAHVYAGWGFSQPFYRHEEWRKLGFASLQDFLVGFWEGFFLQRDANNLLAMIWTWQHADISANHLYEGDFKKALQSITAKAFVLSPMIDLYFPKEDNEEEVRCMPNAEYIEIPGYYGHFAGGGLNPTDTKFLDRHLKRLLESEV
jgi:homoserine O-acetyltransferase